MTKIFNKHKFQDFRADLRGRMTKGEVILWKSIKGDQLGYRFRRQHGIGNYIVDFYCPRLKLALEVDGFTHAEEVVFEKDIKKEKYLKSIGIKVKRYSGEEVFNNLAGVLVDIELTCRELDKSATASATPPTPSW